MVVGTAAGFKQYVSGANGKGRHRSAINATNDGAVPAIHTADAKSINGSDGAVWYWHGIG